MFEASLFISLVGYGLAAVAATGIMAAFSKRLAMRADAHILPALLMAGAAALKFIQQKKANDQAKGQANANNAETAQQKAARDAFLAQFGSQLAAGRTTTTSGSGGGSSSSSTRSSQQQRQIVDPAQAALKAQLEAQLGSQVGRDEASFVSKATRAATDEQIARRERAMRETLGAAAAQRGVPINAESMLLQPAQAEASAARLDATSKFDEMGYERARAAEQALRGLLNDWKGQDVNSRSNTNQTFENFSNSTTSDPSAFLPFLYGAQTQSFGAQQVPQTTSPWISGGGDLLGSLATYYGNKEGSRSQWCAVRRHQPHGPVPARSPRHLPELLLGGMPMPRLASPYGSIEAPDYSSPLSGSDLIRTLYAGQERRRQIARQEEMDRIAEEERQRSLKLDSEDGALVSWPNSSSGSPP